MDDRSAFVVIEGGSHAVMDRRRSLVTWSTGSWEDDGRLVHPLLAAVAVVFGRWHGREALHGGAFLSGNVAVGVLGETGSGKSSLLASIALQAHPVVADDLLVLAKDLVFEGPRGIDLRPSSAAGLGIFAPSVRGGQRRRLPLPPAGMSARLDALLVLGWGETTELRPVAPADRLRTIARHRRPTLPPADPTSLLRLIELPMWELRRPKDWRSFDEGVELALAVANRLSDTRPESSKS